MKNFEPNLRFCVTTSWKLVSKSLIDCPALTTSTPPTLKEEPNGRCLHRVKEEKIASSPFVSQPSGSLSLNLFTQSESLERGWQIVNLGARANASALRM